LVGFSGDFILSLKWSPVVTSLAQGKGKTLSIFLKKKHRIRLVKWKFVIMLKVWRIWWKFCESNHWRNLWYEQRKGPKLLICTNSG